MDVNGFYRSHNKFGNLDFTEERRAMRRSHVLLQKLSLNLDGKLSAAIIAARLYHDVVRRGAVVHVEAGNWTGRG